MKKVFIICLLLIGCGNPKTKVTYILKINTHSGNKAEKIASDSIKTDSIYASTDTAAFSEAARRTTKYFMLKMKEKEKVSKDSSFSMRYSFTVTDAKGRSLTKILPKKYLDSIFKVERRDINRQ